MRTTLSLDDDVAAKLKAEAQRPTLPRSGERLPPARPCVAGTRARTRPFKVVARDLGALRPGLALDSVSDLIETIEGPLAR